jgi:uncharacterized membrane protein YdjX (TVP38/TMEM64 family)
MSRWVTLKKLARPSGVVLLSAVGPGVGAVLGLSLAVAHADALRAGGPEIALLLVVGGALGCGLWLLPTHALSLLCGWSFGLPIGLALALTGATLGSPFGYAVGKRLAGPGVMAVIGRNPKGAAVCEAIARSSPWRAFVLVGLLRLSPVVPYGSTNVLAAVFGVPWVPFLLGTCVGLAPRAGAVVMIGAGVERLDADAGASPWLWGVGLGATLIALVVMSWAGKRALDRVAAEAMSEPPSATALASAHRD